MASSTISSGILTSQLFRIGPISLSNVVNSVVLPFPRGGGWFSSSGYHSSTLQLNAEPQGEEGGGAAGFWIEFVWRWGREVGGERGERGSYQRFDIIMVHYSPDSSPCDAASYSRGQARVQFSCDRSICGRHYRLIAGVAGTRG